MLNLENMKNVLYGTDILKEQYEELLKLEQKIQENEITVSVMGQFKRGKSSLINAIIGEDLLPVGIIPLTTVITQIRCAETFRAYVFFENGTHKEITKDEIILYASEQENPENRKKVQYLKIYTPALPFGNGVVLSDTPGVGSVNKHNTGDAYEYIRHSDVIVFVLSVDSPVSETERDFLLQSSAFLQKFFFVINKCDTVTKEDLHAFHTYCSDTISSLLHSGIVLYEVSARDATGIDLLTDAISKELERNHRDILSASVEKKMEIIRRQAEEKLAMCIRIASEPVEKVREKLGRVTDRQKQIHDFSDELRVISNHRTRMLIEDIASEMNILSEKMQKQLTDTGEKLYLEYKNLPRRDFEISFYREFDEMLVFRLRKLNEHGLSLLVSGYEKIVSELTAKADETADFIRTVLMEEFSITYPAREKEYEISQKSDFRLHTGSGHTMMPALKQLSFMLSRKRANRNFYQKVLKQAQEDIVNNKNNMLSDYRYKMQESLRALCARLTDETEHMQMELERIRQHVLNTLNMADSIRESETQKASGLLKLLKNE